MFEENANLIGFITGFLIVMIISYFIKKKMRKKDVCDYDERQHIVRGIGYKYGFFSMMIVLLVYLVLKRIFHLPITEEVGIPLCIFVALIVFATYCIWKDAYIGLCERRKNVIILFFVIFFINAIVSVVGIVKEEIFLNGKFTGELLNLFCAVTFLFLDVVMLVKAYQERTMEE